MVDQVLRILLLFIVVPFVELAILIELGKLVGTPATIVLILLTGILGAVLARSQGLRVVGDIRRQISEGRVPAGPLVDGVLVLVAGAVLLTPGLLTDLAGFTLLVPAVRRWLRARLLRRFERAVRSGGVQINVDLGGPGGNRPPPRDVTPSGEDDDRSLPKPRE